MNCPCGSENELDACCGPYVRGEKFAPTAEALMRSRYVSYTMKEAQYIASTHDEETRDEVDVEAAQKWAEHAHWLGLEILSTEEGGEKDDKGVVEFIASFSMQGKLQQHRERSVFRKKDGKWFYLDGEMVKSMPAVRDIKKVGRNEPCPCESGKKYKRCCG